jgi:LPS O-antigen subunit length determinant protein (WzzB/FepE family)
MKKDNTYNDEFLDALADKLLDKLLERCSQPEWHVRRSSSFVNNLSGIIAFKENEQERMLGEMSKLMTLMVMYEEKGEQDKALLLQEKINQIDDKLNNR